MTTVAQLAHQFRTTFTATPTTLARSSGFITRQGKLTATAFVRGLTFGWLAHPDARYRQLARAVNQAGSPITPQALEQRFTAEAATLLQQVLAHAVTAVIGAPEVVPSLLDRFTAVWALDSSTITLPAALQATWEGSGRSAEQGGTAGLKTPVALDLRSGRLRGPLLGDAQPQDKRSPLQPADTWERGSLRLTDLGFSSLRVLRDLSQRGVFRLCRAQVQTHLVTADGRRWTLRQLLTAQQHEGTIDLAVQVGATERVPARLIAQPVSPEEAARRRRQVAYRARRTWHRPSEDALALCSWHVCITTLPADLVSAEEAFILLRARWHIELLFKRWKCWGKVDEWRSQKPWRILCEVYAKLLGALVQHWCAVVTCWQDLDRSLVKAGEVVREHARALLRTLTRGTGIQRVLREIGEDCQIACRVNRRNAKPSHSQLIREQHHAAYA